VERASNWLSFVERWKKENWAVSRASLERVWQPLGNSCQGLTSDLSVWRIILELSSRPSQGIAVLRSAYRTAPLRLSEYITHLPPSLPSSRSL
jgi:hypothetical protein